MQNNKKKKMHFGKNRGKADFSKDRPGRKTILFTTILFCCSILTALALSEFVLRYQKQSYGKADLLDPGLIAYDGRLGWRLTPLWRGNHRQTDFEVRYSTNRYGFRGTFTKPAVLNGRRFAFLGDSFTFGFGVNDGETFVEKLNKEEPGDLYLNFAVPGFSTDQEYLLLRQRVFDFAPDVVVLVTYLGNDLFDNLLPFPLQANRGKPYFEFSRNRLILKNSPAPPTTKSEEQAEIDLHQVVMGDISPHQGLLPRALKKSELFQMVKRLFASDKRDLFPLFEVRFQQALKVYGALLEQMAILCHGNGAELIVVLMPGRSLVERPGSPSAQFQDYLREEIIGECEKLHIRLMDLALHLKTVYRKTGKELFHPNEGHMNAEGHQITADYLHKQLK